MKRSPMPQSAKPMKRGSFNAAKIFSLRCRNSLSALPESSVKIKKRKCAVIGCREHFVPKNAAHSACGPDHAIALITAARQKADRLAEKKQRAVDADRLDSLKPLAKLKVDAQKVFNAFIRERDAALPCICCGQWGEEWSRGGIWDAGHYRSRGSADHLRYHENNVHKQLKRCNSYGAGRAVDYRIGLIARIGQEAVDALEANNTSSKWTREYLIGVKQTYAAKLKALKEAK